MRVLIIEDEIPAANRLAKLLQNNSGDISIAAKLDSIAASVHYLNSGASVDLIFMDIQLADGLSFDIFQQTTVNTPVIFTTAFDQYTLKAFKVNSIDYLLKPIDEKELQLAVEKYRNLYQNKDPFDTDKVLRLVQEMNTARYKDRLLIKRGQQMSFLKTGSIAYCYADGKICYAVDHNGTRYLLETNLSILEEQLDPHQFFRINRHLLVNIDAVKKVHTWLGGRLKLEVLPATTVETLVSRERVNAFKTWLGQ